MSGLTVEQAIEEVYTSLTNDNEDINTHIANLKEALAVSGEKEAVFDPARIAYNNREGRKRMQSYFKKRGVKVVFK